MECLCIEIDTIAMEARLSRAKLDKAHRLITSAISSGRLTKTETERLTGFLSFCTVVVRLGRTHLGRLWLVIPGAIPKPARGAPSHSRGPQRLALVARPSCPIQRYLSSSSTSRKGARSICPRTPLILARVASGTKLPQCQNRPHEQGT